MDITYKDRTSNGHYYEGYIDKQKYCTVIRDDFEGDVQEELDRRWLKKAVELAVVVL